MSLAHFFSLFCNNLFYIIEPFFIYYQTFYLVTWQLMDHCTKGHNEWSMLLWTSVYKYIEVLTLAQFLTVSRMPGHGHMLSICWSLCAGSKTWWEGSPGKQSKHAALCLSSFFDKAPEVNLRAPPSWPRFIVIVSQRLFFQIPLTYDPKDQAFGIRNSREHIQTVEVILLVHAITFFHVSRSC